MKRLKSMDRRDLLAIPLVLVVSVLLALGYETWKWSDTLTFVIVGTVGSITCASLYHVDWRPLRTGSRPRWYY